MRSRFLLWSGLVLVLVLAALAVWRGTRAGATTVGVASHPSEPLGASEGLHSPAPAEASLPGARREESAVSGPPSVELQSELVVRVFEAGGIAPVRGADVYLQDYGILVDPELELPFEGERGDVLTGLMRHGRHATTDAEGVARFPGLRGTGMLGVRRGEDLCMRQLDALEPGPVRLVLAHAPEVRVRVVDAQGHPVGGVPVGVRRERGGRDVVRVRSDADGMARLSFGGQRSEAFVGLAILTREPIAAAYSPGAPPAEAIELTLPPTGTLEVELVDERGARWKGPTEVVAELSRRTRADLGDEAGAADFITCFTLDGRASFAHVGLDVEVRLLVRTEGRADEVELVPGPRTAGEGVGVRIALDRPLPELIGRLLDRERRPVGPAWARGTARNADGRTRGGCQMFIDREGRFRHALDSPWNAEDRDGVFVFELEIDAEGGAVWFASTRLPKLHSGVNDLGELMLDEMPLVASGRIVDDAGEPVRRATVDFLLGEVGGSPCSGEVVRQLTTDAFGRFELKRVLAAERVGIRVTAEGFAPFDPLEVPLGSAGLELVLERGGTIVCRVQRDGNWMPRLMLERGGQRVSMTVSYREAGTQEFGPLAPGAYTLRYDDPWSDLQGRVEGIVVEAGKKTLDPRLDPLDLRGRMNTVALTVVDPGGHAVPGLVVALERRGVEGFHDCHPKRDGERVLVTAGALPLRIRLEAPGFRSLVLAGVDSDRRVVLERGPRVQVALLGALPELPEHWSLEGWLRREDPSSRIPTLARGEFTGTTVDFLASDPGRYEFGYELVLRYAGKELDRVRFVSDPAPTFDVLEQSSTQVFRVSAPEPELVDEMLAYADENG